MTNNPAFGALPKTDAALLQIAGQYRELADKIANEISNHNASHDDHSASQCPKAQLVIAAWLLQAGAGAIVNCHNLTDEALDTILDRSNDPLLHSAASSGADALLSLISAAGNTAMYAFGDFADMIGD